MMGDEGTIEYWIINLLPFVSILYGLYPALLPTEKFFKKHGYSNVLLEYQFLKIFNFIVITLMVILLLGGTSYGFKFDVDNLLNSFVGYLINSLLFISIGGILRIVTQKSKKEFRFYFAKACCIIISEKKDDFDKMKYLALLLSSYNKYLEKNLKMEINDMKKIYSVILWKDKEIKNQIIKKICESLDYDKFGLANCLFSIYNAPDSEFYIKESIFHKL